MARYTLGVWQLDADIRGSSPFADVAEIEAWVERLGAELPEGAVARLAARADETGTATERFEHEDGLIECHMIRIGGPPHRRRG